MAERRRYRARDSLRGCGVREIACQAPAASWGEAPCETTRDASGQKTASSPQKVREVREFVVGRKLAVGRSLMKETTKGAVEVCQEIVRKINQHLWFEQKKNYLSLCFRELRLGQGMDDDWARLTPETGVLRCSVRLGPSRGVERWMRKVSQLPSPKFTSLTTQPKPHKLPRVRFSGPEKAFDAHQAFLKDLFAECVDCARAEYPFIPPTRKETAEEIPPIGKDAPDETDLLSDLDELERLRTAKIRVDQQILRKHVLGGKEEGPCAICGETYPASLLVAAHIKKRCDCSDSEKRDKANVVAMCLFGCDALFERGYIGVRNGRVVSILGPPATGEVKRRIKELSGRTCAQWTPRNEPYFKWHDAKAGMEPRQA